MSNDPVSRAEAAAIATEFAAVLRHKLSNRMAAIRNAVYYLRQRAAKHDFWSSDPRIPRFFELINNELSDTRKLLDSDIDRPGFASRFQRASLSSIIERAVDAVGDPQGITVRVDTPQGHASVDADEIVLAIRCLIENAIEAMDGCGEVVVTTRTADGYHEVDVVDEGPGFAEGAEDKLFQPFFTDKDAHQGLGLSIARRIALRHGGRLEIHTATSGGRVTLALPCDRPSDEE